jgi:hypothetical protein
MNDRVRTNVRDIDLTGAVFRKSTKSGSNGGNCVEVAMNIPGVVAVRDSKDPDGGTLVLNPSEWDAFKRGVVHGEF